MKLDRPSPFDYHFVYIFLLSTCLSCVIAWLTPPFSISDEGAHYLRSFEVSHGHWINRSDDIGIPISCREYLAITKQNRLVNVAYYQSSAEKIQPNSTECLVNTVNTAGSYSPISYIASALGIRLAEEFGYIVETRIKVGRLANAIIASLICFLSILAVQHYRLLLAAFIFLPMSMWLRASISADAMTIAISIGYLAYTLHLIERNPPMTHLKIIFFSILACLRGSVKPVYGLLGFSSLILFKRSFT